MKPPRDRRLRARLHDALAALAIAFLVFWIVFEAMVAIAERAGR
ncbi:MAG: hypothetical protein ACE5GS_16780 [Kiloniellaceae bacterium]